MEKYKGKKVLIVGLGKTGFALINLFTQWGCQIRVTDIKPIFDLNKQVKRLKKIVPTPAMTFGEHRVEVYVEADFIIYSSSVDRRLPHLNAEKDHGGEVYSDFAFAYKNCEQPIVAVCGSLGTATTAHMIGYTLEVDKKNVFVGGTS